MMRCVLDLPTSVVATRESLRAVACYAVSPARKAETGRIGLQPVGDGFGTPPFEDGTRIVVEGDELVARSGARARLTTVRAAAELLGVDLSPDPGVGHDLPPYDPDADLQVDGEASRVLGSWWGFGREVLARVGSRLPGGAMSAAQLWPEHFDLAVVVSVDGPSSSLQVNLGASAGDAEHPEPYLYVGPHDTAELDDPYWDEPFGASMARSAVLGQSDPVEAGTAFIERGLDLLREQPWQH
jgi:hypothetical protein